MRLSGAQRERRAVQVSTLWTRESREGGSQPALLLRFRKRAGRYLRFAERLRRFDFVAMHLLAPMADLREDQRVMDLAFLPLFDTSEGDPARFRSRIDFERHLLQAALLGAAILEPDHKGLDAMHDGSPAREQQSRPFGRAGHQGLLVSIYH